MSLVHLILSCVIARKLWISLVDLLHTFKSADLHNVHHCLFSAARKAWLHSGSSRNASNLAEAMLCSPRHIRGKHRYGLPSLAATLTTWKLLVWWHYALAFPQDRRGDWPAQLQCQCQGKPKSYQSEFFHVSILHAMKWKEKISTCKTRLVESSCKQTGKVCVCVCSSRWGGPNRMSRGSTTLYIWLYLSWQTSKP